MWLTGFDKPGGLVVDYLGLADQFKKALITYTESGGQGNPTFDTAQAIAVMLEKHGIACDLMHGSTGTSGPPANRPNASPSSPPDRSTSSNRKTARSDGCRW